MVDIARELQVAVRTGTVVFGIRKTVRSLLEGRAKLVILAANCPPEYREDVEYYAKLSNVSIFTYPGSSIELGAACRRPHRISALAVIDPGESGILNFVSPTSSPP